MRRKLDKQKLHHYPPHRKFADWNWIMLFAWLERRKTARALIDKDASALIERFGEDAYNQSRNWVIGELSHKTIDADRPPGHWQRVRAEIRKRTGASSKTDTATRYFEGE